MGILPHAEQPMRDEIVRLIARAEADGILADWLERADREPLAVAYAAAREQRPVDVDPDELVDELLRRAGAL